jgi:hypothetical protein
MTKKAVTYLPEGCRTRVMYTLRRELDRRGEGWRLTRFIKRLRVGDIKLDPTGLVVIVRVGPDPDGVKLREPRAWFPSDTLYTQLLLVTNDP